MVNVCKDSHGIREKAYLVAQNLADLGGSSVGDGNNLDQFGILDLVDLGRLEASLDVDAPVGAEPEESLNREDGAREDEGPLLTTNVGVVEFLIEIVTEEDRPDDRKGPEVGMQIEGTRAQKFSFLYLPAVDQGRLRPWRRRHGCRRVGRRRERESEMRTQTKKRSEGRNWRD